jgi:glutamine phosphoribosylpyrophosphate amidotransferase
LNEEQVAQKINADKVIYQPIKSLKKAVRIENKKLTEFCGACFNGIYPTGDITSDVLAQIERERRGVQKRQMELSI